MTYDLQSHMTAYALYSIVLTWELIDYEETQMFNWWLSDSDLSQQGQGRFLWEEEEYKKEYTILYIIDMWLTNNIKIC